MELTMRAARGTGHIASFFGLILLFSPLARAADAPPAAVDDATRQLRAAADEKLGAIDREVARLRSLGKSGRADALAARLGRYRQRLAAAGKSPAPTDAPARPADAHTDDTDDAEVHCVGVYEGALPGGAPRGFRQHPPGEVTVDVRLAGRPLVLVLCAYEPVNWTIQVAEAARLQRVILGGYYDQQVSGVPPRVTVTTFTHSAGSPDYFYAFREDGEGYLRLKRVVAAMTGQPVASLQGAYRPTGPFVLASGNDAAFDLRCLLASLEPTYRQATAHERAVARNKPGAATFHAIYWAAGQQRPFLQGAVAEFTAAGPSERSLVPLAGPGARLAVDPRGPAWYSTGGRGIARIDPTTGALTDVKPDPALPEISWPCGIAFDTKRRRVVLSSLGGVGYLYAYEPDANRWSLLNDMANVDLQALTYSAADDALYGLDMGNDEEKPHKLYRYEAATGKPLATVALSERIPASRIGAHMAPAQLVVRRAADAGGNGGPSPSPELMILTAPFQDEARGGGGASAPTAMGCLHVDVATGRVTPAEPMRLRADAKGISPDELKARWQSLRDADAPDEAAKAVAALASAGDAAVTLLRRQLPANKSVDPARTKRLIAALDHDDWKEREVAAKELKPIAGLIEPELRAAAEAATGEVRSRLAVLLAHAALVSGTPAQALEAAVADPDLRLRLRAVRVLEEIATPAAIELLQDLADDPPGVVGARQAQAALRRL